MSDPMVRMLNIIKKTNIDTKSYLVSMTVQSTNPLQFTMGDRFNIPGNFVIFDSYILVDRITVGDKFRAITLNDDQIYYIVDIISSTNELDKYIAGGHGTSDYRDLEYKPKINDVTLVGNKTTSDLGIVIPTKVSDLENDSGFITEEIDPSVGRLNNTDIIRIFNFSTST